MNKRQKFVFRISSTPHYPNLVAIAIGFQAVIPFPTISNNCAARLNRLDDEGTETYRGGVRNSEHANSSDGFPFIFRSNGNQSFFEGLSASNTFFKTSQICFINLDATSQSVAAGPNHGPSDFMKPCPCCLITAKPKDPFESKSTCTVFLGDAPPYSSEPDDQGFSSTLENRASDD